MENLIFKSVHKGFGNTKSVARIIGHQEYAHVLCLSGSILNTRVLFQMHLVASNIVHIFQTL